MDNLEKWAPTIVTAIIFLAGTAWNISDRSRRQGTNSAKLDTVILRQAEIYTEFKTLAKDFTDTKILLAANGISALVEPKHGRRETD